MHLYSSLVLNQLLMIHKLNKKHPRRKHTRTYTKDLRDHLNWWKWFLTIFEIFENFEIASWLIWSVLIPLLWFVPAHNHRWMTSKPNQSYSISMFEYNCIHSEQAYDLSHCLDMYLLETRHLIEVCRKCMCLKYTTASWWHWLKHSWKMWKEEDKQTNNITEGREKWERSAYIQQCNLIF